MNNPWQHFLRPPTAPTGEVRARQTRWLTACLQANRTSEYGIRYGFADVTCAEDFQRRVPIVDYEALAPLIERIADGEQNLLFTAPALAFETTGGSHSGGKLIPYTARGLDDFRRALTRWLADTIAGHRLAAGRVYWALSPAAARKKRTRGGLPVGAGDALYFGEENLGAFVQLSAVPFSVGGVGEMAHWQLLTLYYLIRCPDLALISVWSPAFLSSLLAALERHPRALGQLLRDGGRLAGHDLAADAGALSRYRRYLATRETRCLWPQLALISCWADAASRPLAEELMRHFSGVALQPKGLLSTEAVVTAPDIDGQPALCVDSNFYEFIDDDGDIYLADALCVGKEYGVIVTTNSGLYRYRTGDRVRCVDDRAGVARLRFTGRGGICSDLVGEKLTEPFVIRCLSPLRGFAALAADAATPGYLLLLDRAHVRHNLRLRDLIEQRLCENPQYAYARRLGQLAALRVVAIDNPSERYLGWRQRQGKRLGDIKIPALFTGGDECGAFDTGA